MDDNSENIYITKFGRKSKQKVNSYNLTENRKKKKMPIIPEDRGINTQEASVRGREEDRESLNRLREELEQMRRDLEALRTVNIQQQQEHQNVRHQNGHDERETQVNIEEIATIISNVQNFNLDIKVPKFKDELNSNPMEFLEELEKYFKIKNIKDDRKILIVEHSLEGRAGLWFELQNNIQNYEEFKEQFFEEFYSVPTRVHFKNLWMERRFDSYKDSLQTYYYSQIKESRYFIPKLSEYEINYKIIQQYPTWVKETLATINYTDSSLISQTMANLDGIRREKERGYKNNNQQNANPRIRQINTYKAIPREEYRDYYRNGNSNKRIYNSYRNQNQYYTKYQRDNRNNSQYCRLPDTRYPPPSIIQPNQYQKSSSNMGIHNGSNESNLN